MLLTSSNLSNQLLIAMPAMDDPNFARTVTLICEHNDEGCFGVTINRPPRDGHMAFVRSPDNISIELLQRGDALQAQEPWKSMENSGKW